MKNHTKHNLTSYGLIAKCLIGLLGSYLKLTLPDCQF